jgi:calcium-dependent protein kinase
VFDEEWAGISNDAKSLIKKMLQKDPKKRISAEEAFNDKWIQNNSIKDKLSPKVLS